jgi:hypothetical protein
MDLDFSLHFEKLHILWWKIVLPHVASRHKVHANSIKDYIETMTDLTCMPCYCYSFAVGVEWRRPDLRGYCYLRREVVGCGCLGRSGLPRVRFRHCLHAHHLLPHRPRRHSWFKAHLLPLRISSAVLQYSYRPHWFERSVSSVSPKDCRRRSLAVLDT